MLIVAQHFGKYFSRTDLQDSIILQKDGITLYNLAYAAETLGFKADGVATDFETLKDDVMLPCIALWHDRHYVVIYKITKRYVYLSDPAVGRLCYKKEEFLKGWHSNELKESSEAGILLLLEPTTNFYDQEVEQRSAKLWIYLLPFLGQYRRYVIQLLLSVLAIGLIQLLLPFLLQSIVDQGIRNNDIEFVYIILIAHLVLFGSQTVGEVVRSYLLLHVGGKINISLLTAFLKKLMQLPQAFFDNKNKGDLVQRIYDNERIEDFLTAHSLNVLFSLFSIITFGIILLYYSIFIFIFFAIGSLLFILWVVVLNRRRIALEYKRFEASTRHQVQLQDILYGMPEIRLNGSQRRRRWRWEAVRIQQHQVEIKTLSIDQLQTRGGTFLHELKNIGITFLTAMLVIQGEMTLGMLIAIQYILGQMNAPLLNLIDFLRSAQDARLSLERIHEVNTLPSEDEHIWDHTATAPSGSLHLRNIRFSYHGPHTPPVLSDIDVLIPKGKVTAIVGTSGSGKTTLLKLLLKFHAPQEGEISVGSQKLQKIPATLWLSQCGVVMQNGYIFDDTILANITESDSNSPLDHQRLGHALRIAHIESFIDGLAKGLKTVIGENGVGLSGGQRQRILIARAVYKNPAYLFFDEATSALDAESERYIVNNLENFYQDRTVVIIAHRLSTVKHADQILVLDKGQVVEQGTHSELTYRRGKYFTLVKNQLELGS